MVDAGGDLARADHLLQGHQHQLDGQEGHALVEEVQGAEEQQVPAGAGERAGLVEGRGEAGLEPVSRSVRGVETVC